MLFPPAGGDDISAAAARDDDSRCEGSDAEENTGSNIFRPPPAIVRLTPKAELVLEYRARFFERSSAAAVNTAGAGGQAGGRGGGGGGGRVKAATSDGAAVADMESVVMQEAALQRRVEAERVRLATKVSEGGEGRRGNIGVLIQSVSIPSMLHSFRVCITVSYKTYYPSF